MNQKHCRGCPHLDFNEMSDEMYCKLKDYELIRLRWHKTDRTSALLLSRKAERMKIIGKVLCFLGFHKYQLPIMWYLYDEHQMSIYRIDRKCSRCGKIHREVICFPII